MLKKKRKKKPEQKERASDRIPEKEIGAKVDLREGHLPRVAVTRVDRISAPTERDRWRGEEG